MILDELTEFADAVSVANAAATINVGDVIDTQIGTYNTLTNIGAGEPLFLVIQVDTSIITGGVAGTIQFRLVSDSVAVPDLVTCSVHAISASLVTGATATAAAKTLAGSYVMVIGLPNDSYERYLGIQAIVGTTTTTAGNINAFLVNDVAAYRPYADAVL